MENILNQTIDNGVIKNVHIVPLGTFNGSSVDGSAVEEKITVEKLEQLADKLNNSDEVLCDTDHSSCKAGVEKNSKAVGWFSRWIVDPLRGLFGTLSLTKYGRELLENREYRYTSPVFTLNENGEPIDLHSVGLTNVPAFKGKIKPIINSEANEALDDEDLITKDILLMNIDELKKLIIETISEIKDTEAKEEIKDTEAKEEIKEEVVENEESSAEVVEEEKTEVVEEEKTETTEEIKNEETEEVVIITSETVDVSKDEEEVNEKEDEEEVIKIEALNSAPSISLTSEPVWKNLKGKEFFDWLKKHPNGF